jgi:hypothetical protein
MHDGRQRAAGALAGLGIRELAASEDIEPRALRWLETCGEIHVFEKKRDGHMQRAARERILAALATAGFELLAEGGSFGAGVGWKKPPERRLTNTPR